MRYDPTREALYFPERQHPVFPADIEWSIDRLCAELSRKAYIGFERDPAEAARLTGELAALGFGEPTCFAAGGFEGWGAQGFAARSPRHGAVIAFRGTQITEPIDGLIDLLALRRRWEGPGKVHSGFRLALSAVKPQVDAWLADLGDTPLTITGHSLGAAMATVLAAGRIGAGRDIRLVTFGSPLVGDRRFAAALEAGAEIRRYVDCSDIVTTLPFWWPYRHAGGMLYIDSRGRIDEAPCPKRVRADRRTAVWSYFRAYADVPDRVLIRKLADHAPINYVSALLGLRTP